MNKACFECPLQFQLREDELHFLHQQEEAIKSRANLVDGIVSRNERLSKVSQDISELLADDPITSTIDADEMGFGVELYRYAEEAHSKSKEAILGSGESFKEYIFSLDKIIESIRSRKTNAMMRCPGPLERKKYILFGEKTIECSLIGSLPILSLTSLEEKPNKRTLS
mgnify:CR=1 FL=1